MSSFDELAEMKTAVSKQQSHFKQRQKIIILPLIPTLDLIWAISSLSQWRLNLPYMLPTVTEKHRLLS
jgi:hypothetical protein